MATKGTFDVTLLPMDKHGDGSPNPYAVFGQAFIRLCDLIGAGTDEVGILDSLCSILKAHRKIVLKH